MPTHALPPPFSPDAPSPAAWLATRERLALAFAYPDPVRAREAIDGVAPGAWPRWSPAAVLAATPTPTSSPDGREGGEEGEGRGTETLGRTPQEDRQGPTRAALPTVLLDQGMLPPHDLLGRLVQHPSWAEPVHQAVLLALLDRLLDEGEPMDRLAPKADVHTLSTEWRPPLQWATLANRAVVVERLLDRGADPSVPAWMLTTSGSLRHLQHNALVTAAGFGSPAMVRRLLATDVARATVVRTWVATQPPGSGRKPVHIPVAYSALHAAVRRPGSAPGDLADTCEVLDLLVAAGVPVNLPEGQASGPLHQGVEDGQPPVVAHLLALGADPHRRNHEGLSAWDELRVMAARWDDKPPRTATGGRAQERVEALRARFVHAEQNVLRAAVESPGHDRWGRDPAVMGNGAESGTGPTDPMVNVNEPDQAQRSRRRL